MLTTEHLEQGAEGVRFGRSRALRVLGGALFGLAARAAIRADEAGAYHDRIHGCGPSGRCHCCSGTSCCSDGCSVRNGECDGNSSHNSWLYCHGGHSHRCADWWDSRGRRCICRGTYERRCGDQPCGTGTNYDVYGVATNRAADASPLASSAAIVQVCAGGVAPADLAPTQVTDLVASAEALVEYIENAANASADPERYGVPTQVCVNNGYPFDNICVPPSWLPLL